MVAKGETKIRLIEKVAEIYNWLDEQIRENPKLAGKCSICGKCCDFEEYLHSLFLTTPELIYLADNLDYDQIKPMTTGCCPYRIDSKCSIYEYRFAGCRIFCCTGDTDFQSRLSESSLEMFKNICTELDIPYLYTDLAAALNSIADV